MFGIIGKVKKGFTLYNAVKDVIDEGKDVVAAAARIQSKYDQLDDDLKAAWDEVSEFVDAIKRVV